MPTTEGQLTYREMEALLKKYKRLNAALSCELAQIKSEKKHRPKPPSEREIIRRAKRKELWDAFMAMADK